MRNRTLLTLFSLTGGSFGLFFTRTWRQQHHHFQRYCNTNSLTPTPPVGIFQKIASNGAGVGNNNRRSVHKIMSTTSAGDMEQPPTEHSPKNKALPKKAHTATVCVVPPPENIHVWREVSKIRSELKDPGYFRWPPHINLLYPFVELRKASKNNNNNVDTLDDDTSELTTLDEIVAQLVSATESIPPFSVQLSRFGTFGGKRRGVLWLHPDDTTSSGLQQGAEPSNYQEDDEINEESATPLLRLQSSLETAFPMCSDGTKPFTPHMTVSHFSNLEEALRAKETITLPPSDSNESYQFVVDRIYVLGREGDEGQFLRIAEIPLGSAMDGFIGIGSSSSSSPAIRHNPPAPFPDMPTSEEDWVYQERMLLKSRRKSNRKSNRWRQQQSNA